MGRKKIVKRMIETREKKFPLYSYKVLITRDEDAIFIKASHFSVTDSRLEFFIYEKEMRSVACFQFWIYVIELPQNLDDQLDMIVHYADKKGFPEKWGETNP